MKVSKYLKTIVIFLFMGNFAFGYSLTADEILQTVDDHRLVSESFEMTIRVDNFINGQNEGSTVMRGHVNNGKLIMLSFLEPMKMRGRKIVIEGDDMRLIIPNVRNPVRITPSQRLVGGISYGDVAAISYADDYAPKLIGEETVMGMDSDGTKSDVGQCFVLELTAKETTPNYHKIILWVEKQYYLPVKGDFFALSGKKMTTVYYTNPKECFGKNIITKMFLFDQINSSKYFSMEYSDFKVSTTTDSQ